LEKRICNFHLEVGIHRPYPTLPGKEDTPILEAKTCYLCPTVPGREDGLECLQQMELERVSERLGKKWELERLRLQDAAVQTAHVRNDNNRGLNGMARK